MSDKSNVLSKTKIAVEFEEVEDTLHCGLRIEWVSGTSGKGKKKKEIRLTAGAGCGSPFLIFTTTEHGKSRYLVLDVRNLIITLDEAL